MSDRPAAVGDKLCLADPRHHYEEVVVKEVIVKQAPPEVRTPKDRVGTIVGGVAEPEIWYRVEVTRTGETLTRLATLFRPHADCRKYLTEEKEEG